MSRKRPKQRRPQPANEASSGRRSWLPLGLAAAIAVATVLAYGPSLGAPFYFDDNRNIVHNPLVRDLSWFARPWAVDDSGANHFHLHSFKTRYVTNLSFALNYGFGGLSARGYHATNLALHLIVALFVALSVRRLFELEAFRSSRAAEHRLWIAGAAAALFALHPIQTETVTYTVQRAALLAGLFSVIAFWAYLRALAAEGAARVGWAALGLAMLVCGSLSKQNAVVFPLVLLAFDLLFVRRERRARLLALALAGAALLVVPLQRIYLLVRSVGSDQLLERATSLAEGTTRFEYLLTELRVVVRYLGLLLMPIGLTLEHDVSISRSLAEPAVLISALLLAAIFGAGLWLAWPHSAKNSEAEAESGVARSLRDPAWRLVGFGALWFFLCLSVESSVIPIPDPMLEHRLYLPSVGFFLSVPLAVALAGSADGTRKRLALLALITFPLAMAAHARNATWAEPERFWYDMLEKSPRKARVVYNVGFYELQRERRSEALALFERTVELDPKYAAAWIWIGNLERQNHRPEAAVRAYESAIAADPANWVTRLDLRTAKLQLGDLEAARRLWGEAVEIAGSREKVEEFLRSKGLEKLLPERVEALPAGS